MDIFEIVMKLNGSITPVGDSHVDSVRYENLERLMSIHDNISHEIASIITQRHRHEASVKKAGTTAFNYFYEVRDLANEIIDEED